MKKIKNIVQKILSIKLVNTIVKKTNLGLLWFASRSVITSMFYYIPFFFLFIREQYAVVVGRYQYYKNLNKESRSRVYLRRNIHRIEKGMVMQPRRDVFAVNYIEETVDVYKDTVEQFNRDSESIDRAELEWAHDVLEEYFKIVKLNDYLKKVQVKFQQIEFTSQDTQKKIPFKRDLEAEIPVSYEKLHELSKLRRSVRWFEQKEVPRELIDKALLIGEQSPTACNRLPYEFRIFDEPELVRRVSDIPFGAGGYSHNIPTLVVVVGKLGSYFSARDRHVMYIDASLAAMGFIYALETLGLSSSIINWPDFEPLERKMQKALNLRTDERPVMLIAVGYPDPEGMVPYSEKKELETLRSYNKTTRE